MLAYLEHYVAVLAAAVAAVAAAVAAAVLDSLAAAVCLHNWQADCGRMEHWQRLGHMSSVAVEVHLHTDILVEAAAAAAVEKYFAAKKIDPAAGPSFVVAAAAVEDLKVSEGFETLPPEASAGPVHPET